MNSDDTRLCSAVDCNERIPPQFLMCGVHWYMVPKVLRVEIYRQYTPGQDADKPPTQAWIDTTRQAINFVARKENKPPLPETAQILKTLKRMIEAAKAAEGKESNGEGT